MSLRYFYLLFILLGLSLPVRSNFVFSPGLTAAYQAVFDLRLNDARKYIAEEKKAHPENGLSLLLENYVDYIYLLTSDHKDGYESYKSRRADRLDALEDNDEDSPYYLFSQAEVYLQWGLIKARFGDYTSSTIDLKKAQNLLRKNDQRYPDFLPDQKSLALIEVVFGAIPSNLKGIADFLGIRGNKSAGVKQLESFKRMIAGSRYSFYNDEAVFLLCFIDIDVLHEKDNYARLITYLKEMNNKSLLRSYLEGYVAFKTGHNDEAIAFLEKAPVSSLYTPLPAIQYILGSAKLCRLDSDAHIFLSNYIKEYKGINYIKDAYLKMAFHYLVRADAGKYNYCVQMARTKGFSVDEKDKQALREANDLKPDTDLLKARLYFDGGYYQKALAMIRSKQADQLKNLRDRIELHYRLGRIYDKLNSDGEALAHYQNAIKLGRTERYYYAANSALFAGMLCEEKKDNKKAAYFYNAALQMKNHEYQNSIDTQAKEGLGRLR